MKHFISLLSAVAILCDLLLPSTAIARVDGPDALAMAKLECAMNVLKTIDCDAFIQMTYSQQEININLRLSRPCEMSLTKELIDRAGNWCTVNKGEKKNLGDWFISLAKDNDNSSTNRNMNNKPAQNASTKTTEKLFYGKFSIESVVDESISLSEKNITVYKDKNIVFTGYGKPEYKKIIKNNTVIYFLTLYNVGSGGGGKTFIFDDNGNIYKGIPEQAIIEDVKNENNIILVNSWISSDDSRQGLQRTFILQDGDFITK